MSNSTIHRQAIHVLFVCLGNICRSPMAESIFRHMVERASLADRIKVDSAGTGAWHVGQPPHQGTRKALMRRGITTNHTARVVTSADFARFDYVIMLDSSNLRDVRAINGSSVAQLGMLLDYAPQSGLRDVPDPYFDGRFEEVYTLVEQGCQGLLDHIIATHRLNPRHKQS